MDILKQLDTTFQCECGKTHSLAIKKILYQENATGYFYDLTNDIYNKIKKATLIADERTFEAAGRYVEKSLSANHINVHKIIVRDPAKGLDPLCDEATKIYIKQHMSSDTELMLACGSGVISDLTKWISFETHIPYIMIPTAASMNGYASSNIAPLIGGVKRLMEGTTPLAIIADANIIRNAPYKLTTSGLGDVLAKPVSTADWLLNSLLFGDYYCQLCVEIIKEQEKVYLKNGRAIKNREPQAMEALFFALIFSGIAMTIAATSAPASGGEHLISHTLDMLAIRDGKKHDYHGRQVGIGTIFAAALYEVLFEMPDINFRDIDEELDKNYWGTLSETVEEEFLKKKIKAAKATRILSGSSEKWKVIKGKLKNMLIPAKDIKLCLEAAGAAHKLEDIECSKEYFIDAVLHSNQIRERYTVLDLAKGAGITKKEITKIVEALLME